MNKINFDYEKKYLEEIVKTSKSYPNVLKKLNIDYSSKHITKIKRLIKKFNINVNHFQSIINRKESINRWKKDNLEQKVKISKTFLEILDKLNLLPINSNYVTLKKYLNLYNIDYKHILNNNRWTEQNLKSIICECNNKREVLVKLNLFDRGNNIKTLNKYIDKYNIDISHFKNDIKIDDKIKPIEYYLKENSNDNRRIIKKRLYKEGLKERKCELCGQTEEWKGKQMSLILDHINGIHNDNRLENLRIVCPNCNATLETHCGKNKKKIIREEKYIESRKKYKNNIYSDIHIDHKRNTRKVERPSYEQLIKEVEELGYSGTGRKYGVSDNSIRKWIKVYINNNF